MLAEYKVAYAPATEAHPWDAVEEVSPDGIIVAEATLELTLGGSDGMCTCVCISDCRCDPGCLLQ